MAKTTFAEDARMKSIIAVSVLTCSVMTMADYSIDWYTIDGGGGTSTGGPYTLTGTIGQADAAVSSAAEYVLSAGFWPGQFGCMVNLTDLMIFVDQWMLSSLGEPFWPADFDQDYDVDIDDFATLSSWWFDHCPAGWPLR